MPAPSPTAPAASLPSAAPRPRGIRQTMSELHTWTGLLLGWVLYAMFLTGSVSRKMHLHARRLIIDHPVGKSGGGGKLDVTAPLPEHFAASMIQLGFDESLSDASPTEGPPPPSREDKKQAARQHAKQLRKSKPTRRGRKDVPKAPPKKTGPNKSGAKPGPKAPGRGKR